MFIIPKIRKWDIPVDKKVYKLSLTRPSFFGGKMIFKIDDKEFVLAPLKPISFGFARTENFKLGAASGVLKIAKTGEAEVYVNGKLVK